MIPARALVIDDDATGRRTVTMHLEDLGVDVVAPDRTYAAVGDLVSFALDVNADVTICDHRLQPGGMASFFGAEAVDALVGRSKVAILMTSYFDSDFDTSIRQHKRSIPTWLSREQLEDPEPLALLMATVKKEINGILAPDRELCQTVVRVGDVVGDGEAMMLDVFVDGWRPDQAVRMPPGIVPSNIAAIGRNLLGKLLIAEVNTGALGGEDVYFGSISGPVEPGEWSVTVSGSGAAFPRRSDEA